MSPPADTVLLVEDAQDLGPLLLIWGATIIVVGSSVYYNRRIGGVTGDCLGATCLLVETWGLALFSCQRCM